MLLTKKDTQKSFTLLFTDEENKSIEDEKGRSRSQNEIDAIPIDSLNKFKISIKKGKSLESLIEPILETRGLSFETHSVFLESSKTPLPLGGETSHYVGSTLYVRKNEAVDVDKRIISLMRFDSKRSISSSSTKRFSEILEQYERIFEKTIEDDDRQVGDSNNRDEFEVEERWQNIIKEPDEMSIREKVQQEAIWELFTSEARYIKDLQVITEVFQSCFKMIQDGGCMAEVDADLIFANIEEVYQVNVTFWRRLKKVIDNARGTKQPIKPQDLVEPFREFEDLFQPYIQFCNADTSNMKFPDSYSSSTNDMFKQFVAWCDAHERCKRLTMAGFLIKPLQRVTKYSLLLKAILNKTDEESVKQVVETIMQRVETFVSQINKTVHLRQEQEKLKSVINRLSDYNPVEAVTDEAEQIIKEFCNLNLKGPIPGLPDNEKRFILKEGPMKLVEKQGKKEVYAFLFSDVFVITKLKRNIDKYRIHRPPYRLNKVQIHDLKDPGQLLFVYLNEYGVLSNAFGLQVSTEEVQKWKDAFEKAKTSYELTRTEFALRHEFWDDDLPTSPISKNKILRRHAESTTEETVNETIKSSLTNEEDSVQETSPEENPGSTIKSEDWENAMILSGIILVIVANIIISRFFGFFG